MLQRKRQPARGPRRYSSGAALRVMSPDGFPIYAGSETNPGAYVVTCHSGVSLAGAHALDLAPRLLGDGLDDSFAAFSARRFHVPSAA